MTTDTLEIQKRLTALGFAPGPVDGVMGPMTEAAIVAFKRSVGLRARPYVGPITEAALRSPPPISDVPWMDFAGRVKGLHETRDHGRLRAWLGASTWRYDPREVPWCGGFVETCYRFAGIAASEMPDTPEGAQNWRHFGFACGPNFGACLVFWRGSASSWKGHVGFCWGEDPTHFHVLGGNQSNAVTVSRISKDRLVAARWPNGWRVTTGPIHLSAAGVPVTTNEA